MRIATHKIYRAFPELDRFDDERCRNFVRSANRGFLRHLLPSALIFLTFLFVAGVCGYLFALAYIILNFDPNSHPSLWWSTLGMAIPALICPIVGAIAAMVVRDVFLRRRIRRVITLRGTCSECDYVLLGLNVGPDLKVTCPECGSVTIADESMNELADGSNGQRVFSPPDADSAAIFKPQRHWVSKHTRRLILRGTLATAGLFVLGLCVLWLVVYLQTRSDIAAAKAELADVEEINAMLRAQRPKFLPDDAPDLNDEWKAIADRLREITKAAEAEVLEELPKNALTGALYVDWVWLYRKPQPDDPANVEQLRRAAQIALEQVRAENIEPRLCRALISGHGTVEFLPGQSVDEESQWTFPRLSDYRHFTRLLAFALHDAHRENDDERFRTVADAACAIVAHVNAGPGLISELIAVACEAMLFDRFRSVLIHHPSASQVEAIRSAMNRCLTLPDAAWMIDSEAALSRRMLAHEFASHHPNPVVNIWRDFRSGNGRRTAFATFGLGAPYWHQTGRFSRSVSETNRVMTAIGEAIALEPHARRLQSFAPAPSSQRLVSLVVGFSPRLVMSHDGRTAEHRGLQIMLALESHRLEHGRYPDELTQLAPAFLTEVPIDPYSGKPFRYRLLDPQADPHGRGYLLWSVGFDGTDDGGIAPANGRRHEAINGRGTPFSGPVDLVINEPSN
ncbi:MAG: hypothetical protein KF768_00640 [Phycisphaeraceae bacterium]|nr:hypothetical protein [Phycisphaeraceae bacterium]